MTTPLHEKTFESDEKVKLPRPFVLRRLHSLLGLWLVIYLFEHLLVNSQMAMYFQDDGSTFVSMVNSIHNLPYLKAVEIIFLGLPFLIHGYWGILYAFTGKANSSKTDGTKPALPQYKRNRAYTWQRATSWLLIVGIIAHVVHMRFLDYPSHTQRGDRRIYMANLSFDPGLPLVAKKLGVKLFNEGQILKREERLKKNQEKLAAMKQDGEEYVANDLYTTLLYETSEEQEWLDAAMKKPLKRDQVLAAAPSAGAAFFLIVRQAFTNPTLVILYSFLVIAAAYHAFNGLWTFLISWGVALTRRSQKRMRAVTVTLMSLVMLMGLAAAWGTYWTTVFQR